MVNTRASAQEAARLKIIIKSALNMFEHQTKFFNSEEVKTAPIDLVRSRLDFVLPLYSEVKEAFNQLLTAVENESEREEIIKEIYGFYDAYCILKTDVERGLQRAEQRLNIQPPVVAQQSQKSSLKTQKIELPEFNGAIESWTHFRDMFIALVHNNEQLEDIQKYHFLRMAIKLPSGSTNILDGFSFDARSYKSAWNAVQRRYNDKRKIVNHHFKTLYGIKKCSNGSSSEIRRVIDAFSSALSSLRQQGFELSDQKCELSNLFITHMVIERLDNETLKEWRKKQIEDFSTWHDLYEFLNTLQRSLDDRPLVSQHTNQPSETNEVAKSLVVNNSSTDKPGDYQCLLCSKQHRLHQCEQFRNKSISDRHQFVKDKRLCYNCLGPNHQLKDCKSKIYCRVCNRPHNTLIHFDSSSRQQNEQQTSQAPTSQPQISNFSPNVQPFIPVNFNQRPPPEAHSSMSALTSNSLAATRLTMLSTVSVLVADKTGEWHLGRALLDSGSDVSFMTPSFAAKLGLALEFAPMSIKGIHGETIMLKHRTETTVKSRYNDFRRKRQFSIMDNIAGFLPSRSIQFNKFNIPEEMHSHLADPLFHKADQVDLLLDNAVYWDCLMESTYQSQNGPTLRCSRFGWLIGSPSICAVLPGTLRSFSPPVPNPDLKPKCPDFFSKLLITTIFIFTS